MLKFIIIFLSLTLLSMSVFLFQEATFDVNSVMAATSVEPGVSDNMDTESNSPSGTDTVPLKDYKVTLTRPLFSPDRLPQKEQEEVSKTAAEKQLKASIPLDNIKLSAVIITSETKEAMFMQGRGRGRDVVRVKEGGVVGEWTLSKIEEDRVVISRGDSSQEILLRVYPPPGTKVKKRGAQGRVMNSAVPVAKPVLHSKGFAPSPREAIDPVSLKRANTDSP